MWKNIIDWGRWQHEACAFHAGYLRLQNTPWLCNTHCFSTATKLTRTRLNVTLYVQYIACLAGGLSSFSWETSLCSKRMANASGILHCLFHRLNFCLSQGWPALTSQGHIIREGLAWGPHLCIIHVSKWGEGIVLIRRSLFTNNQLR